jgi:hypothetical protein
MAQIFTAPSTWLAFTWNARSLAVLNRHVELLKIDPKDTERVQELWENLQTDAREDLKHVDAKIADLRKQLAELRQERDRVRDFIVR